MKLTFRRLSVLFLLTMLPFAAFSTPEKTAEGGKYDPVPMIMHHIQDANEIHLFGHVSVPLPVIVYNTDKGSVDVMLSSAFHHGETEVNGYKLVSGSVETVDGSSFIDFSITKNVATMLLVAFLMCFIFISVAKAYEKRKGQAPKGLQSFFEPLIKFVIDDIAKPNLGNKYEKFLPYLLTVFFFIWIGNFLGLIPFIGGANMTGNIAVTAFLALTTLLLTNLNGNKHYWKHIFLPPVPVFVMPIMWVVEIMGIFIKPIALMIRLFANITAGHVIVLSLVSLIFVFGEAGTNLAGGATGAAIAVPFVLFMNIIELLVAFLQAFIFTILTALFIGQAVEDHH